MFVQSIDRAKELLRELVYDGIQVDVMHAARSQQQREEVIRRFRTGDIWVLICTDLMARGIDFKGVQMVNSTSFLRCVLLSEHDTVLSTNPYVFYFPFMCSE